MTKTTEDKAEAALAAAEPAFSEPKIETAMDALHHAGREPLRIWRVKGPKGVFGEIAAVLCQDTNSIVMTHTLPSGKWSLFEKVAK